MLFCLNFGICFVNGGVKRALAADSIGAVTENEIPRMCRGIIDVRWVYFMGMLSHFGMTPSPSQKSLELSVPEMSAVPGFVN